MALKVVIVGQAPRSVEHPDDHEVWVINGPHVPPRWDVLFQLHGPDHIRRKHARDGVWALMEKAPRLVTTEATAKALKRNDAEVYPLDEVLANGRGYLTNSFAMAIVHAVNLGAKVIVLDGIMIPQGTGQWDAGESWIAPCVEYHLGRAEALGVQVTVPPGCGLFRHAEFVYGFDGPGSI
jgi:hypothetical protein